MGTASANARSVTSHLSEKPSFIQHLCHSSPRGWGAPMWSGSSTNTLKMQNTGIESHSRDRSSFSSFPGGKGNLCSPALWGIPLIPQRGAGHLSEPTAAICCPWLRWFDGGFLPLLCVVISGQGKIRPSVGVWNV